MLFFMRFFICVLLCVLVYCYTTHNVPCHEEVCCVTQVRGPRRKVQTKNPVYVCVSLYTRKSMDVDNTRRVLERCVHADHVTY